MIKNEFKRIGVKIFVRLIILILFGVICYLASNVLFISPVFAAEMPNGDYLTDINDISLGLYSSNTANTYYWGSENSNHPTQDYYNNTRTFQWKKNGASNYSIIYEEFNFSNDISDYDSVFFYVYEPTNYDFSVIDISANRGLCEIIQEPYRLEGFNSNSNYDILYGRTLVHCNHLSNDVDLKIKLHLYYQPGGYFSVSQFMPFSITAPIFYNDDQQVSNVITSQILDEDKKTNEKLDRDYNFKNSEDTTGANSKADDFFNNFDFEFKGGIAGIITAPLNTIQAITGSSCSSISLTIPFVNRTFNLPCMSTIYQQHFGNFLTIYRVITFGIITYWCIVKSFSIIKNMIDPDDDKVEVLEL